jgi:hypothetical protein
MTRLFCSARAFLLHLRCGELHGVGVTVVDATATARCFISRGMVSNGDRE